MPTINQYECPQCNHRLSYPTEHAGKKAACPKCGHHVRLPSPGDGVSSMERVLRINVDGTAPKGALTSAGPPNRVSTGIWDSDVAGVVIVLTSDAIIQGTTPGQDLNRLRAAVERGQDLVPLFKGTPLIIPIRRIRWVEGHCETPQGFEVSWPPDDGNQANRVWFNRTDDARSFLESLQTGPFSGWKRKTFRDGQMLRTDIVVGVLLSLFVLILALLAYGFSSNPAQFERDLENEPISLKKFVVAALLFVCGRILGPLGITVVGGSLIGWIILGTIRNCVGSPLYFRLSPSTGPLLPANGTSSPLLPVLCQWIGWAAVLLGILLIAAGLMFTAVMLTSIREFKPAGLIVFAFPGLLWVTCGGLLLRLGRRFLYPFSGFLTLNLLIGVFLTTFASSLDSGNDTLIFAAIGLGFIFVPLLFLLFHGFLIRDVRRENAVGQS